MSARLALLIACILAGIVYTIGAINRNEARWSRVQCAVLAVITYAAAVALALGGEIQ